MMQLAKAVYLSDVNIERQKLEELSAIDDINIDIRQSVETKTMAMLEHMHNPYCYMCDDVMVKIEYTPSFVPLQTLITQFLIQLKQTPHI